MFNGYHLNAKWVFPQMEPTTTWVLSNSDHTEHLQNNGLRKVRKPFTWSLPVCIPSILHIELEMFRGSLWDIRLLLPSLEFFQRIVVIPTLYDLTTRSFSHNFLSRFQVLWFEDWLVLSDSAQTASISKCTDWKNKYGSSYTFPKLIIKYTLYIILKYIDAQPINSDTLTLFFFLRIFINLVFSHLYSTPKLSQAMLIPWLFTLGSAQIKLIILLTASSSWTRNSRSFLSCFNERSSS